MWHNYRWPRELNVWCRLIKKTIDLLDRTHSVPHTIPKIYGQSSTSYKKHWKLHSEFDWWYCHPPEIQYILSQWGENSYVFWKLILVKVKGVAVYWYEEAVEKPHWISMFLQLFCAYLIIHNNTRNKR